MKYTSVNKMKHLPVTNS